MRGSPEDLKAALGADELSFPVIHFAADGVFDQDPFRRQCRLSRRKQAGGADDRNRPQRPVNGWVDAEGKFAVGTVSSPSARAVYFCVCRRLKLE